jgi:menaquinone-dependent protoporphyrinogen oxidase
MKGLGLMSILILYGSEYGATEKCVQLIMKHLRGKVDAINLNQTKPGNIDNYDIILIGGGIYAGKLQSNIVKFVEANEECLRSKKVGMFICCKEGEKAVEYVKANIPNRLVNDLFMLEHTGYEINLERMNRLEKFLIKSIFKIKESYSQLNYDAINRIGNKINEMDR